MKNLMRNSAWLYDLDFRDIVQDDIPFYIEYAVKQQGNVLELGCGTGRVTLPLAAEGFSVAGMDLSQEMLDVFRKKSAAVGARSARPLSQTGTIEIIHGNMADFNLNQKFSMIIAPFRAFQVLTEEKDISSCLTNVKQHLADDGIFIINVFNPYKKLDESWCYPETVQWETLDKNTGNYVVKKHWGEKIDAERQIVYPNFAYEVTYPDGATQRFEDKLKMKYYYYHQLKATLEAAGFKITEEYSWYDKTPIPGREIIFVCRREGKRGDS